ncbi:hypothetical protein EGW08_018540, partial [Elysia chlorotica]
MFNACLLFSLTLACILVLVSGDFDEANVGYTEIGKHGEEDKSTRYAIKSEKTDNMTTLIDVDWTQPVVILHNRPEFRLKMEKSQTLLVAISVLCKTPSTRYSIFVDTINAENGYVPEEHRRQFFIACNDILSHTITNPLVNTTDGYRSTSFRLPKMSQNETANSIVSEWLSLSLFQSSSPEYFNSREGYVEEQWLSRAKAAAEMFLEGGRESPSPRIAQVVNITITADLIGRTRLRFFSLPVTNNEPVASGNSTTSAALLVHEIPVVILRNMRPIDFAFRIILFTLVGLSAIGMGCKTDLNIVKEVLKKPVAPAMGFVAQYLCMPLIAFAVSQLMPLDNPAVRLGIFACGVCPGGGASNIFTFLLRGDVSLSVTMTCLSSVLAMAMIPLWMFTLGQRYNDPENNISVRVPFTRILQTVSLVVAPLFLGFFLNVKFPKLALKLKRLITPIAVITVLFILTVGLYSNWYMVRLFRGGTVAAACLLPYVGYMVGAGLALVSCQPVRRIKTVAIETGIQNTTVAYLMLTFSLPAPDADLAAVGSASSAFMTPLPLLVLSIVYRLWLSHKK